MTGYIPWRKIESEADYPETEKGWLVTDDMGGVYSDWRNGATGEWENAEAMYGQRVVAYAPLPAPYDPDAPEPVDARDAEIAALKARCERLERDVAAFEEQLTDREKEVEELSAAIWALAAELEGQAIPQMGPGAIAKRLREIAG